MPWLAWRWTVCPAPFLPQLVPARQQHCRGRPLATSYQGHAGSWAASGHGKRYSCRHIYSFIVYLRFFPSLPSFTKGERDKKTIYQLFHFVCVCFATHKYASECKRCIVCRGVYLTLGSGMVDMYPQPPAWRPSLPCLAQWAATAVTGPQRRQQQQTTADNSTNSNVLLWLLLCWLRWPASGALARLSLCYWLLPCPAAARALHILSDRVTKML